MQETPVAFLGLPGYHAFLEWTAALVAVVILLSSLDDLFIDAWYWTRRLARWWTLERTGLLRPLTAAQLHARPEQPLAIMVPAWKEADVIAAMVDNMVQVLDYREYVVFVGTYCNDQETIAEVERIRRRYRRQVHRVEVPHPGPTCKADCLNHVVGTILAYEQRTGIRFAGVVLHDSEDVLHPLELKFFNYLLPRKDMIQLPVASLERRLDEWVAGTYMDEFAESHGKEMVVRESLAGMVPSAGVGTCFSRRALDALMGATGNAPFNTASLTEDYDVGMRLQEIGMQSIFGRFPVDYRVRRKTWGGEARERELRAPLSVREFFPDSFRAAYRQKSRWVLGIGLQGWHQIPWRGRSAKARYFLLHDRKGVVTSFVSIAAYVLLLQFLAIEAGAAAGWWPQMAPHLFVQGSAWVALAWLNAAFLANRAFQRAWFCGHLYGWRHALVSLPRMVVGNFVNCMAVARAWRLYIASVVLRRKLAWDKTAHDFPEQRGAQSRQRLGELLQAWRAVDAGHLEQALQEQGRTGQPLGRVLVARGWLDEDTLAEAIACQADLPRAAVSREAVQAHARRLPVELMSRLRAVSLGVDPQGRVIVAASLPPEEGALAELAKHLAAPPVVQIARDSEIAEALQLACAAVDIPPMHVQPNLAEVAAVEGAVDREAYESAVRAYRPEQHGSVGELLVERGVILAAAVKEALNRQLDLDLGAAGS